MSKDELRANRARGRTNITLEPEVAAMLKAHLDSMETKLGFRPTSHQVVSGLIRTLVSAQDDGK